MDDYHLDLYAMKNMDGVGELEAYLRERLLRKERMNVIKFAYSDTRFYWAEIAGKPDISHVSLVPEEERKNIIVAGTIWTLDKVWFLKERSSYELDACIRWDIDIPFLSEIMYPFQYMPSRNS